VNETAALDIAISAIIANLSQASRKRVMGGVSRYLRKQQQKRITAQQDPDGNAFAPRKRPRDRQGNARGKMFARIKLARNMRALSTPDDATVTFKGPKMHTEEVHQFGLRDRVSRTGPDVQYPQRRLLGFASDDEKMIYEQIIDLIAR
jgi:phage virion morphogenesis protein